MAGAFTAIVGFADARYEGPAGALPGTAAGFFGGAMLTAFNVPALGPRQTIFGNTDGLTRGWRVYLDDVGQFTAQVFHDGPGSITVADTIGAGLLGSPNIVFCAFEGDTLALVVNGSIVGTAALPPGASYLPGVGAPALGALAGGAEPLDGGAILGALYTNAGLALADGLPVHWIACTSSRDVVDGSLGSLYGANVVPSFDHLWSARRGNNGGAGQRPVPPNPLLAAGAAWPDQKTPAVNFAQVSGGGGLLVFTSRDRSA